MKEDRQSESECKGITRRSFVRTGGAALAGGAALGGAAIPASAADREETAGPPSLFPSLPRQEAKIQSYRTLGRTGFQVSDIGFGSSRLKGQEGLDVTGFVTNGRTFGAGKCFKATISNVECAVMIPNRTHYTDVLEVISSKCLKKTLGLDPGDPVEISILF